MRLHFMKIFTLHGAWSKLQIDFLRVMLSFLVDPLGRGSHLECTLAVLHCNKIWKLQRHSLTDAPMTQANASHSELE